MTLHVINWTIGTCQHSASYKHKSDHRDGTPGKSQWTVSEVAERQSFADAMANQCVEHGWGWGVHVSDGGLAMLGVDRDHVSEVFISRFDFAADEWHGYPVDYRKPQQKPPGAILLNWVAQAYLGKAQMRKIVKGQPCRI